MVLLIYAGVYLEKDRFYMKENWTWTMCRNLISQGRLSARVKLMEALTARLMQLLSIMPERERKEEKRKKGNFWFQSSFEYLVKRNDKCRPCWSFASPVVRTKSIALGNCKKLWSLRTLSQVHAAGKWEGSQHSCILASRLQAMNYFPILNNLHESELLYLVNWTGPLKKF